MIKYIEWGEHLRWGNFCYLWAGINYIAKESGHKLVLPDYFAWKYLQNPPEVDNNKEYDELFHFQGFDFTQEKLDGYIKWFKERKDKIININLGSHLQSEKWFLGNLEYVKSKLLIKQEEIGKVKEKYSFFDKPTIGIGIRLGDFVGHGCFYQIPFNWYTNALKFNFPNYRDYNIVVFSDDINKAKDIFKDYNFLYPEPNNTHLHTENFKHYRKDPMEQFILSTLMDNYIFGSSTFSWWAAWYIKNFNNGKVIHSGRNLTGDCLKTFYNPDYYPEIWTEFAC